MTYPSNRSIHPVNFITALLVLLALTGPAFGQKDPLPLDPVVGPASVEAGSTQTYYYNDGDGGYPSTTWAVVGGTVQSTGLSGSTYHAVVQWGASPGSGSVSFRTGPVILGKLTVTITQVQPPAVPDMPVVTNYPGYTRLTRGTPPAGETWYWQGAPGGTDTSNPAQYVDRTTGTAYYLRSYDASTSLWGPALTVNYTIDPLPVAVLSDENYVHTIVPQVATTDVASLSIGERAESVTYYDGLGRPMQTVGIRAGGNDEDIITHIGYDGFGRRDREYLPYSGASNGGLYRPGAEAATLAHYDTARYEDDFPGMTVADINPYSETHFEASPLNRVLEQGAPGKAWKVDKTSDTDHTIKFVYGTNTANEVRLYGVSLSVANNTYTPTLTGGTGYYGEGELYRTVTRDENWTGGTAHTTEEFKDRQGRVVLKRTYGDSDVNGDGDTLDAGEADAPHDTYYVYDDYGNLSYVLPPRSDAQAAKPSATVLDNLCYQYTYDHRNRLVEKKVPGKGREYIVYNKLDRPIMTQDTNMKDQGQWLVTKYDALGRVAYTAMKDSGNDRIYFQTEADGSAYQYEEKAASGTGYMGTYYTSNSVPTTVNEILTVNYYDDYGFDTDGMSLPATADGQPIVNHDNAAGTRMLTRGLATGSRVRVLGTTDWITTVTGYDAKGRPVYVASKNDYLSTADIVVTLLDFVGNPLRTTSTHARGKGSTTIVDVFGYDAMGRLTAQRQQIGTQPEETIVENGYDDLGQLVGKGVGGATTGGRLQTVDYAYNIRGWLKGINDTGSLGNDLFAFGIGYDTPGHGAAALYNGNIAETEWRTANTDSGLKWYAYAYDALNRITGATGNTDRYDLDGVAYDRNGNITALERRGNTDAMATAFGVMDDLAYTYLANSNRLVKVADSGSAGQGFGDGADTATEYTYDANGNMVSDANKGITSIAYNHLNLPTEVVFDFDPSEDVTHGTISYVYDATGTKLSKYVTQSGPTVHILPKTTQYAGGYVYEDGQLKFISQPEGYVEPDGNGNFDYIYQYRDHLGNIRLSYRDNNGTLEIVEENNYYPFGLKHKGYNNVINGTVNHYKDFQGQELTEDLGLNVHEWKYRISDPAIGRFWQIDPLAEDYYHNSTYAFSENRVIDSAELEGLERIYAADGKFIDQVGNSDEIRVMQYTDSNVQSIIDTANNTELSSEERSNAVSVLNENSFHGYNNADEAAGSFAYSYNAESIADNQEYGAAIFDVSLTDSDGNNAGTVSILSPAVKGGDKSVSTKDMINSLKTELGGESIQQVMPGELSGLAHTHGRGSNDFSDYGMGLQGGDLEQSAKYKVPVYMSNKRGELKKFDYYEGGSPRIIRTGLPTTKR